MTPANEFRAARARLGITQQTLADRLKIRVGSVSSIEQGIYEPSESTLELLRYVVADGIDRGA